MFARKVIPNTSMGWKATVDSFPLIGYWTMWRFGDRRRIGVGEYPWEGLNGSHRLDGKNK